MTQWAQKKERHPCRENNTHKRQEKHSSGNFQPDFFEKSTAHDLRTSAKSSSNPAKQAASKFRSKSQWPKAILGYC
jgi:hypothetical protein